MSNITPAYALQRLESAKREALAAMSAEGASPTSKLAWYYTHVGEMEMLHQLGIIERSTFDALSAEWREYSPLMH